MKIDAHQHFWKFDPVRDSWINDEMRVIQKDFLPENLYPILAENGIDGCVTVQSDQSEEENIFQLANAERFDFIKGVVGWVDLQSKNIEERLIHYSACKKMKGFRHILQGEPRRDFMLQPAFMHGISLLCKYNFTYDILISADQLQFSRQLAAAFPYQPFVIDHIAKPDIKHKRTDSWKRDIFAISACENVFCKISGMVTEGNWKTWKKEDFTPYLDAVTEAFGTGRIIFGSDWPVCLVAASYAEMIEIINDYFSAFSKDEKELIFGRNAIDFYQLGQ